jgi:septal ring factor EnvC (AmiA/AmiB activator)
MRLQNLTEKIQQVFPENQSKVLQEVLNFMDELVKVSDFNELKLIVKELAEAQKRTDIKIGELVEAQKRTEQKLEELTEAQKRTEQKLEELAEAQKRTEQKLEELVEAQKRTEQKLESSKTNKN